ncbi:MAG: hypothetical protein ACR2GY_09255 [Phycisphaerales bacterium]
MMSCAPPGRLSFPSAPLERTDTGWLYDVDRNGVVDFSLAADESGALDLLAYDDDEDGHVDRIYRLSAYEDDAVPHVIIMLDSIAFRTAAMMYDQGELPLFHSPVKVIPPFPSMSEVIFATLLHTAPQPGMINRHYDRRTGATNNMILKRAFGKPVPMDSRLDYRLRYWEGGMMFLSPRPWFHAEMKRAKAAVDDNPLPVSILYFASTAGLVSKYGESGATESLTGIMQLCMQLLYERQGAIKISLLADHGHNYREGQRFDLEALLEDAGFNPTSRLNRPEDVVIDVDGMVNYSGLHTYDAATVARIVTEGAPVQIVAYMEGERVIVRSKRGEAAILYRDGLYHYEVVTGDVLDYALILEQLADDGDEGTLNSATGEAWFAATVDHQFPNAVPRLWHAFHGLAINPPDVMLAFDGGYYYGLGQFEWYIDMASTHGGIDQNNSATFVMSMTNRVQRPMTSSEVLPTIEPAFLTKGGTSKQP